MKQLFQKLLESMQAFFDKFAESIVDASGLNYEQDSLLDKTNVFTDEK